MKAIEIHTYGGDEVITMNPNKPVPAVSSGQLLIKMHAAGVNPVDWKIRAGYLQQMRPLNFPVTLGMDFSGTVEMVGAGVSNFKKDEEVYGMTNFFSGGTGTFAKYFLVDAAAIAHKPKNISFLEASVLPMAGVSALQALVDYMRLSRGQKILIHGGNGGIGTVAIQLAKHLGAYVATTVREENKLFVHKLGADEVIDYKTQRFENLLKNYDAVFDTIGGDIYRNSFKILKKNGIIVSMLEQPNIELMKQYGVNAIAESTDVNNRRLTQLADLVEHNEIKVHIAKTFSLAQTREALAYLENEHPQGKVVVTAT